MSGGIAAGTLDRRIMIEVPGTSKDSFGQPTQMWNPYLRVWAKIRAVTGKELYAASGFTSQVTHMITIRYLGTSRVQSNMRVKYGQRIFLIQAVLDPDEQKRELNLICFELNDGAGKESGPPP